MSTVGQTRQRSETESPGNAAKKAKVEEKAEVKVGVVTTFQSKRGYGFISQEGGPDVFVHQSQIFTEGDGFRILNVGQKVEFTAICENNKWKATRVTGLNGAPVPVKAPHGKKGKRGKEEQVTGAALVAKVQTQIEYYLSDKNLCRDRWMRTFLETQNAIAVSNLLKCNKLKSLTTDLSVIQQAVNESKVLHLTTATEEGQEVPAIGRGPSTDNVTPLPDYTPPATLLLNDLSTGENAPIWKDIRAGFLATYAAPLFVYISHATPFIVINGDHKDLIPRVVEGGIKDIEGKQLCSVSQTEAKQGEALLKFHYEALAAQAKKSKARMAKKGKGGRNNREQKPDDTPVMVGTQKYESQQDVYDKVKGIMQQYKNATPLLGEDKKFMMTLLKAHPKAATKMKFARQIVVKENSEYEGQSRCFFVVNKDNNEEDISYVKCIRNLPVAE